MAAAMGQRARWAENNQHLHLPARPCQLLPCAPAQVAGQAIHPLQQTPIGFQIIDKGAIEQVPAYLRLNRGKARATRGPAPPSGPDHWPDLSEDRKPPTSIAIAPQMQAGT